MTYKMLKQLSVITLVIFLAILAFPFSNFIRYGSLMSIYGMIGLFYFFTILGTIIYSIKILINKRNDLDVLDDIKKPIKRKIVIISLIFSGILVLSILPLEFSFINTLLYHKRFESNNLLIASTCIGILVLILQVLTIFNEVKFLNRQKSNTLFK